MMTSLSASAQKVQDALDRLDLTLEVVELPDSTRTAFDAAQAIGCTVAQIAKSLIFRGKESGKPLLVIVSGVNRVNEKALSRMWGEVTGKADADYVRTHTGFAIGGIPPVGHLADIDCFIDEELLELDEIWAAAGTPNAVFRLTPDDLVRATGGKVVCVF